MGGRAIVGRRPVFSEVDLDDLHDASAPRLRFAHAEPAGADRLRAASRWRTPTRWRDQLRMARAGRDVHHRHGALHPLLLRVRRRPSRYSCRLPAPRADVRRRLELPAALWGDAFFGAHDYQRAGRVATL